MPGLQIPPELIEREAAKMKPAVVEQAKPDKDALRALRWLMLAGGGAADLVGTEMALKRHGNYEANPIMQGSPWKRIGIKAGSTIGSGALLDFMAKKKGPARTAANIIAPAIGGSLALLGLRNARMGKK